MRTLNIDDITVVLDSNFRRINNLVTLYEKITPLRQGRKPTSSVDLLRVTVVLLHATFEDFLRSTMKLRLPLQGSIHLNKIPLYKEEEFEKSPKFNLGDVSKHRGKTVDELIKLSVHQYLDRESFNNSTEVIAAITSIGIEKTIEIENLLSDLDEMITRRHKIVHQADKSLDAGSGYHRFSSLSLKKIKSWIEVVDLFILELIKQLDNG
ncbi:MAG: HEPN domain-containing protein [Bacteroidota bacterium]